MENGSEDLRQTKSSKSTSIFMVILEQSTQLNDYKTISDSRTIIRLNEGVTPTPPTLLIKTHSCLISMMRAETTWKLCYSATAALGGSQTYNKDGGWRHRFVAAMATSSSVVVIASSWSSDSIIVWEISIRIRNMERVRDNSNRSTFFNHVCWFRSKEEIQLKSGRRNREIDMKLIADRESMGGHDKSFCIHLLSVGSCR